MQACTCPLFRSVSTIIVLSARYRLVLRRARAPCAARRSDDNASVKPKMLYASSKDALKKALTGITEEYQATDRSDLDFEEIKKKAGSC
mmetsp:Transcript_5249/g.11419  ORF Transcript_5249/g.11419 Transcript_5249/m.11419 type:complete len:89 (-) Transcript_5249:520-786(-)|eukprot:6171883-Pleurochrysis_carterae.AAC.1